MKEHSRMTVKSSIKKFDEIVFIVFASSLSWPLIVFRKHHPNNKTKQNKTPKIQSSFKGSFSFALFTN
jgi:hypothetical protein